jgi:hypothetical protein
MKCNKNKERYEKNKSETNKEKEFNKERQDETKKEMENEYKTK